MQNRIALNPLKETKITSFAIMPEKIKPDKLSAPSKKVTGIKLREDAPAEDIIDYIDNAVELSCKLIKIHPFYDGNGRSTRALLNIYFKMAGIPPVYVTYKERDEYLDGMAKAIRDKDYNPDYSSIKKFYY